MEGAPKISPYRLSFLLRLEKNPSLALELFRNPRATAPATPPKPFRYSARSYDLIICKLGRARMFAEMEDVLHQMSVETRFTPKEALFCHVISFYGRARLPVPALHAFERIASFRCRRTIRSFNSLLHAMINCGDLERVQSLWQDLDEREFVPDACTYNVLIHAATLSGSLGKAWDLFDEMRRKRIRPSVATFGTLVSALCGNSKLDEAFRLKKEMIKLYGVKPNVYIYTSLIKGLCNTNMLDLALKLKQKIILDKDIKLDSAMYSTLIRALFRDGRKGEVVGFLEEMKEKGIKPDTVTYNAMIAGFCEDEKDFDAAFEVLNEMARNGCKPDVMSYNTIIAGFCKERRWRHASELFEDMPRRGCRPDLVTYRTLFEGMCDAGELKDAGLLLDEMVFKGYAPGAVSVRKFVEGVSGEGAGDRVGPALCSLAKLNAAGVEVWEKEIRGLLNQSELLKVVKFMDRLRMD
ncbi:putative pentatricopeptide repeat-containing protein [Cocos nucifera]|uniref:Putative pentatricopeptide repeat-containing protein n=1 Tax=Cocos nucifera TaxID=13894 RepID=A0A8K0I3W9_COCNU|nr:putative pentatricopeptide repeat-containing protein [Cocos nucifera]